jgi:hypothetical protein
MKKYSKLIVVLSLVTVMAGCEGSTSASRDMGTGNSVSDVLEAGMRAEDEKNEEASAGESGSNEIVVPLDPNDEGLFDMGDGFERQTGIDEGAPEPEELQIMMSSTEGIDVDLTVLSPTMVYAQVFDMIYKPESYIGKTVKMQGLYTCTDPELTDVFYCACVVQDATQCCSNGIEFELSDDYAFPQDYPEYGDTITVLGTFDLYEDQGYTYCTLRNSTLLEDQKY